MNAGDCVSSGLKVGGFFGSSVRVSVADRFLVVLLRYGRVGV